MSLNTLPVTLSFLPPAPPAPPATATDTSSVAGYGGQHETGRDSDSTRFDSDGDRPRPSDRPAPSGNGEGSAIASAVQAILAGLVPAGQTEGAAPGAAVSAAASAGASNGTASTSPQGGNGGDGTGYAVPSGLTTESGATADNAIASALAGATGITNAFVAPPVAPQTSSFATARSFLSQVDGKLNSTI